jgi:hypothetical protein
MLKVKFGYPRITSAHKTLFRVTVALAAVRQHTLILSQPPLPRALFFKTQKRPKRPAQKLILLTPSRKDLANEKSNSCTGPEGSRRFRLLEFLESLYVNVVRLSALRTGRLYPPPPRKYSWYSFLLEAEPEGLSELTF